MAEYNQDLERLRGNRPDSDRAKTPAETVTESGTTSADPAGPAGAASVAAEEDTVTTADRTTPTGVFRPEYQHDPVPSGFNARVDANLAALELLRVLDSQDRPATADEQAVLARWSGWGAVSQIFDDDRAEHQPARDRLRGLLSDEEYAAARANTLNAHYTDTAYVQAIWDAVGDLGFTGGRVLEPGCGSGNFIGLAPADTTMTGVEMDPVTAGIAAHLYPNAQVVEGSFADLKALSGSFDAAVGNVPFGKYSLVDKTHNPGQHSIHNHFLIKSLRLTRPGGLVAAITSRYTMDAVSPGARREMADLADLVGAVRLPSKAHQRAAGTAAVTDVLIFRRRADDAEPHDGPAWDRTAPLKPDTDSSVRVNQYFLDHPERVVGDLTTGSGMFGDDLIVKSPATDPADIATQLRTVLAEVVTDAKAHGLTVPDAAQATPDASPAVQVTVADTPDEGHLAEASDGTFTRINDRGDAEPVTVPKNQRVELGRLLRLRDTTLRLLAAEGASRDDTDEITALRAELKRGYDHYVATHGPLNRATIKHSTRKDKETGEEISSTRTLRPGQGGFRGDPHSAIVYALEHYDPETGVATGADILTTRVINPPAPRLGADTPEDAIAICLDRRGRLDLDTMADLLGVTSPEAREQLGQLVFDDPATGQLVTAEEYLSGDVVTKLDTAEAATEADPAYTVNVEALAAVQPEPLSAGDIEAQLGAVWITPQEVQQFARETLDEPRLVVENPQGSLWTVSEERGFGVNQTSTYGTPFMIGSQILERLLTKRPIRITKPVGTDDKKRVTDEEATSLAEAKAELLTEAFQKWCFDTDPDRAVRLVERYNRKLNNLVPRRYNGDHLTFPGLSLARTPRQWQRDAVARMIAEPSMGLFHEVGAGKTLTMAMGIMEMKRLGLVHKPAVTVPINVLEQFQQEWLRAYPQANLLTATSHDLRKENRRRFAARIATGNWDAVIFTHSAFEKLPVGRDTELHHLHNEVDRALSSLDRAKGSDASKRSIKQMEAVRARAESRAKRQLDKPRDTDVTFEDTGIDYIAVDEAHTYKNRRRESNIQEMAHEGVKKSADFEMKLDYLRRRYGRACTMATGTPISNSMGEVHTVLMYLIPDRMQQLGLADFDAFIATFAIPQTTTEVAPEGGLRQKTRFSEFVNIPEMFQLLSVPADIKLAEDLNLPRPALVPRAEDGERRPSNIIVPPSTEHVDYLGELQARAVSVRNKSVDKSVDHLLKITADGTAVAVDVRLRGMDTLEPQVVDAAADRIAELWAAHRHDTFEGSDRPGALQLVFCDMSTPGGASPFVIYDELRRLLEVRGMDPARVRFVHEADSPAKRAELFAACRDGGVDVIIGSTPKMGQGTNIQTRAVALHHLDCTWRPSDIQQREGRVLRQGNAYDEVNILRYGVEGSAIAFKWQKVSTKAKFISQALRGDRSIRRMEDIDQESFSFDEITALTSGNPLLLEQSEVKAATVKLERLERSHRAEQRALPGAIAEHETIAADLEAKITAVDIAMAKRVDTKGDNFRATVGGVVFDSFQAAQERCKQAAAALAIDKDAPSGTTRSLGHFAGFALQGVSVHSDKHGRGTQLRLDGAPDVAATFYLKDLRGKGTAAPLTVLRNKLGKLDEVKTAAQESLRNRHRDIERARAQLGVPFDKADELRKARTELKRITQAIADAGLDTPGSPVTDPAISSSGSGPNDEEWAAQAAAHDAMAMSAASDGEVASIVSGRAAEIVKKRHASAPASRGTGQASAPPAPDTARDGGAQPVADASSSAQTDAPPDRSPRSAQEEAESARLAAVLATSDLLTAADQRAFIGYAAFLAGQPHLYEGTTGLDTEAFHEIMRPRVTAAINRWRGSDPISGTAVGNFNAETAGFRRDTMATIIEQLRAADADRALVGGAFADHPPALIYPVRDIQGAWNPLLAEDPAWSDEDARLFMVKQARSVFARHTRAAGAAAAPPSLDAVTSSVAAGLDELLDAARNNPAGGYDTYVQTWRDQTRKSTRDIFIASIAAATHHAATLDRLLRQDPVWWPVDRQRLIDIAAQRALHQPPHDADQIRASIGVGVGAGPFMQQLWDDFSRTKSGQAFTDAAVQQVLDGRLRAAVYPPRRVGEPGTIEAEAAAVLQDQGRLTIGHIGSAQADASPESAVVEPLEVVLPDPARWDEWLARDRQWSNHDRGVLIRLALTMASTYPAQAAARDTDTEAAKAAIERMFLHAIAELPEYRDRYRYGMDPNIQIGFQEMVARGLVAAVAAHRPARPTKRSPDPTMVRPDKAPTELAADASLDEVLNAATSLKGQAWHVVEAAVRAAASSDFTIQGTTGVSRSRFLDGVAGRIEAGIFARLHDTPESVPYYGAETPQFRQHVVAAAAAFAWDEIQAGNLTPQPVPPVVEPAAEKVNQWRRTLAQRDGVDDLSAQRLIEVAQWVARHPQVQGLARDRDISSGAFHRGVRDLLHEPINSADLHWTYAGCDATIREAFEEAVASDIKASIAAATSETAAPQEQPVIEEAGEPSAVSPTPVAPMVKTKAPVSAAPRASIGGITPTDEQQAILDACRTGDNLVIEAGAGTGKTSTLKMAASVMKSRSGLYLAFNKTVAQEAQASFPSSVTCMTANSLGFRAVGRAYKHRLDKGRMPAKDTARLLGITSGIELSDGLLVDPANLARMAMGAVEQYCRSVDDHLQRRHVRHTNGIVGADADHLAGKVLSLAQRAWEDLQRRDGKLKFTHDHYMKMWALTRPTIAADYILYDEAQDADPLMASIVQAQDAQLIAVGDSAQSIYSWRGAVNAIETWPADTRLHLSTSWRFGPQIADEANKWLDLLDARLRLTGRGPDAVIGAVDAPDAVLCRTNGEAITQVMGLMDEGRDVGLIGGGDQIQGLAQAARALQSGRGTSHPELFAFRTWGEVREYVKHDEGGADLATFVNLIDTLGADSVIEATSALTNEEDADVVVSTAHKAKGREWNKVKVAGDFREPSVGDDGEPGQVPRGEAMLAYVTVTRAKSGLDRGGLAWIDDRVPGASDDTPEPVVEEPAVVTTASAPASARHHADEESAGSELDRALAEAVDDAAARERILEVIGQVAADDDVVNAARANDEDNFGQVFWRPFTLALGDMVDAHDGFAEMPAERRLFNQAQDTNRYADPVLAAARAFAYHHGRHTEPPRASISFVDRVGLRITFTGVGSRGVTNAAEARLPGWQRHGRIHLKAPGQDRPNPAAILTGWRVASAIVGADRTHLQVHNVDVPIDLIEAAAERDGALTWDIPAALTDATDPAGTDRWPLIHRIADEVEAWPQVAALLTNPYRLGHRRQDRVAVRAALPVILGYATERDTAQLASSDDFGRRLTDRIRADRRHYAQQEADGQGRAPVMPGMDSDSLVGTFTGEVSQSLALALTGQDPVLAAAVDRVISMAIIRGTTIEGEVVETSTEVPRSLPSAASIPVADPETAVPQQAMSGVADVSFSHRGGLQAGFAGQGAAGLADQAAATVFRTWERSKTGLRFLHPGSRFGHVDPEAMVQAWQAADQLVGGNKTAGVSIHGVEIPIDLVEAAAARTTPPDWDALASSRVALQWPLVQRLADEVKAWPQVVNLLSEEPPGAGPDIDFAAALPVLLAIAADPQARQQDSPSELKQFLRGGLFYATTDSESRDYVSKNDTEAVLTRFTSRLYDTLSGNDQVLAAAVDQVITHATTRSSEPTSADTRSTANPATATTNSTHDAPQPPAQSAGSDVPDQTSMVSGAEPTPPAPQGPAIIVAFNDAEGIHVTGTRSGDGAATVLGKNGLRLGWAKRKGLWYDRGANLLNRNRIDEIAAALRDAGFTVSVTIQDQDAPQLEPVAPSAEHSAAVTEPNLDPAPPAGNPRPSAPQDEPGAATVVHSASRDRVNPKQWTRITWDRPMPVDSPTGNALLAAGLMPMTALDSDLPAVWELPETSTPSIAQLFELRQLLTDAGHHPVTVSYFGWDIPHDVHQQVAAAARQTVPEWTLSRGVTPAAILNASPEPEPDLLADYLSARYDDGTGTTGMWTSATIPFLLAALTSPGLEDTARAQGWASALGHHMRGLIDPNGSIHHQAAGNRVTELFGAGVPEQLGDAVRDLFAGDDPLLFQLCDERIKAAIAAAADEADLTPAQQAAATPTIENHSDETAPPPSGPAPASPPDPQPPAAASTEKAAPPTAASTGLPPTLPNREPTASSPPVAPLEAPPAGSGVPAAPHLEIVLEHTRAGGTRIEGLPRDHPIAADLKHVNPLWVWRDRERDGGYWELRHSRTKPAPARDMRAAADLFDGKDQVTVRHDGVDIPAELLAQTAEAPGTAPGGVVRAAQLSDGITAADVAAALAATTSMDEPDPLADYLADHVGVDAQTRQYWRAASGYFAAAAATVNAEALANTEYPTLPIYGAIVDAINADHHARVEATKGHDRFHRGPGPTMFVRMLEGNEPFLQTLVDAKLAAGVAAARIRPQPEPDRYATGPDPIDPQAFTALRDAATNTSAPAATVARQDLAAFSGDVLGGDDDIWHYLESMLGELWKDPKVEASASAGPDTFLSVYADTLHKKITTTLTTLEKVPSYARRSEVVAVLRTYLQAPDAHQGLALRSAVAGWHQIQPEPEPELVEKEPVAEVPTGQSFAAQDMLPFAEPPAKNPDAPPAVTVRTAEEALIGWLDAHGYPGDHAVVDQPINAMLKLSYVQTAADDDLDVFTAMIEDDFTQVWQIQHGSPDPFSDDTDLVTRFLHDHDTHRQVIDLAAQVLHARLNDAPPPVTGLGSTRTHIDPQPPATVDPAPTQEPATDSHNPQQALTDWIDRHGYTTGQGEFVRSTIDLLITRPAMQAAAGDDAAVTATVADHLHTAWQAVPTQWLAPDAGQIVDTYLTDAGFRHSLNTVAAATARQRLGGQPPRSDTNQPPQTDSDKNQTQAPAPNRGVAAAFPTPIAPAPRRPSSPPPAWPPIQAGAAVNDSGLFPTSVIAPGASTNHPGPPPAPVTLPAHRSSHRTVDDNHDPQR